MENQIKQPLVSCIMPTANRQKYVPLAIKYFLEQDYLNTELIIIDDGLTSIENLLPDNANIRHYYSEPIGTIGTKRNIACEKARGEIIMHWDDDDWHAKDWISRQVDSLMISGADITGIEHVHFYSPIRDTLWLGTAQNRHRASWLNGATLAYWKRFWKFNPFQDLQTAEDDTFIQSPGARIYAHDYIDGFVAILHADNTTVKYFERSIDKRYPQLNN